MAETSSKSAIIWGALAAGATAVAAFALYKLSSPATEAPRRGAANSRQRGSKNKGPKAPAKATASRKRGAAKKTAQRQLSESDEEEHTMELGEDGLEMNDGEMAAQDEIDEATFQRRLVTKVLEFFRIEVEEMWTLRAAIDRFIQMNPQAAAQMRHSLPPEVIEMAIKIGDHVEGEHKVPPEHMIALFCLLADGKSAEEPEEAIEAMKKAYSLWRKHPQRPAAPEMEIYMLLGLARAKKFKPEDECQKYLDQARKLAVKAFGEGSIEVSSIDIEIAAMLITARKPAEAQKLLKQVIALRESIIPVEDKFKYSIMFYTYITTVRFFCMEELFDEAKQLLDQFVDRTMQTFADKESQGAAQIALVGDILSQQKAMLPAQQYLLEKLKSLITDKQIDDPQIAFKLSLSTASNMMIDGDLLEALEQLNMALENVKKMTDQQDKMQSEVTGLAYKGIACVQLGGEINHAEADRCFKRVMPFIQHFEPQMMLAIVTHLYVLAKAAGREEEVQDFERLLPAELRAKLDSEGIRAVFLDLVGGEA